MKTHFSDLWQMALIAGVICSLCACADVNKLREAQASFNDAATADSQSQLAAVTRGGVNAGDLSVRASTGYARTIAILKGLSSKETDQLKTDKLLGSAQMMQALSYWRLKDYDNATSTANGIDPGSLYPRDAAMRNALPSLIKISEANADIYVPDPKYPFVTKNNRQCLFGDGTVSVSERKKLSAINKLLTEAITELDGVQGGVSQEDPVYIYLVQATLAAYKNRMDALANRCTPADFDAAHPQSAQLVLPIKATLDGTELTDATEHLKQLFCALQGKSEDASRDPLVQFWATAEGLHLPSVSDCVTK